MGRVLEACNVQYQHLVTGPVISAYGAEVAIASLLERLAGVTDDQVLAPSAAHLQGGNREEGRVQGARAVIDQATHLRGGDREEGRVQGARTVVDQTTRLRSGACLAVGQRLLLVLTRPPYPTSPASWRAANRHPVRVSSTVRKVR